MPSSSQTQIIEALEQAVKGPREDFIYAFLQAYQTPPVAIERIRQGDRQRVLPADGNDVAVKSTIYFRAAPPGTDLQKAADEICGFGAILNGKIPFILVTDFENAVGVDLDAVEQKSFAFAELKNHFDFFLPLIPGYVKASFATEHPADAKACRMMGHLYDGIQKSNKYEGTKDLHALNLFLTRLMFCFFAEDTGIFPEPNMMTSAISSCTRTDGSDLPDFFADLFKTLNTPEDSPARAKMPDYLRAFPYVNGGLFEEKARIPGFDGGTRGRLIDCGKISWSEISPDIFGSMFQAVMDQNERRALGAHYTSEQNILKVLKPLFLDGLREELNWILLSPGGPEKKRKLGEFHDKLARLQFLDPACGSGNFLIIAYRELRRLENRCIAELWKLGRDGRPLLEAGLFVKVHVDQFHGIELLEFPADIARVSLHLMEHVMNLEMRKQLDGACPDMQKKDGRACETIPLKYQPGIVCGNALTKPWEETVGLDRLDYVFGNPPFVGGSFMEKEQKEWMAGVFGKRRTGMLDFVGCWFELASLAMSRNPRLRTAFVSTNSICQGEEAGFLWKPILDRGQKIRFAHRTFRWSNDARDAAAVHCVVVGFDAEAGGDRQLFAGDGDKTAGTVRCKAISPYLIAESSIVVQPRSKPLSAPVPMVYGNKPTDGGHLIIEDAELKEFTRREPKAEPWIRRLVGSKELLHGIPRWCLWLVDAPEEILRLPLVAERVERRRQFLLDSKAASTRAYAAKHPELFRQVTQPKAASYLVIPRVSSERRPYIPMAVIDKNTIVTDLVQIVPGASLYDFGIATSAMHMVWMRTVCGRMKSDYRYSSDLCWNTFPWPSVDEAQKARVEDLAKAVLEVRDRHVYTRLGDMYDPVKMPKDLRDAHRSLDLAVDALYRPEPFASDEDRLQLLFQLYERLVEAKEG